MGYVCICGPGMNAWLLLIRNITISSLQPHQKEPLAQPWKTQETHTPVEQGNVPSASSRAPSSRRSAAVRQPVAFPERGAQAEASAWPAAGHFCWKLQSATWEFLPPFLLYLFPFSWGLAFFSVRLIACLSLCPGLSLSAPLLKDQRCQRENFYKCQIHTPTPLILSCFQKRWVCLAFGL